MRHLVTPHHLGGAILTALSFVFGWKADLSLAVDLYFGWTMDWTVQIK
jgi:hypothetical protein